MEDNRSSFFELVVVVEVIVGLIGGIIAGNIWNWRFAIGVWLVFGQLAVAFYGLYVHLSNQEQMIAHTLRQTDRLEQVMSALGLIDSKHPETRAKYSDAKLNLSQVANSLPKDTWACKKCETINPIAKPMCKDCGSYR